VIGQNAAELVEDDGYMSVVDAISQEQTWFDGAADNNPPGDCPLPRTEAEKDSRAYLRRLSPGCRRMYIDHPNSTLHMSSQEYLNYLKLAKSKGKTIFTVDYAVQPENVAWVLRTSRNLGFVPFVGSRRLNEFIEPR
jgi:endo-alpha-1,4-polygalactosaminidase (GH114 family)